MVVGRHIDNPNSKLTRLKHWLHTHPWAIYLLVGVGLILIASLTTLALLYQKPVTMKPVALTVKPKPKPPAPKYYSPLTGLQVTSESDLTKPITAIMIENSPDARPQSGLKQAEVVYEAIAEGGITRFMALYQQNKPQLLGPVRSVRLYDLDWMEPYDSSIAHVGGSAAALQTVRSGGWRDLDEFFNGAYYWRTTDRWAPHNMYTSFAKLDALNQAKGYTSSHPKALYHTDVTPAKTLNATHVSIHISGPLYDSSYVYDSKTGLYDRSQAGAPHLDREEGQIAPKVVIALYLSMHEVMQDGWREDAQTTGSGDAVVFQDGTATKVTWNRATNADQVTFVGPDGKQFGLDRGQVWITALPTGEGNATWQ